ncbi:MAG: hypothetical protein AAF938_15675 [Myxococcota bacterium]
MLRSLSGAALAALLITSSASAQDLGLRITTDGFDAIGELAEELAPTELSTPELDTTLFDCPATARVISAHVPPTDVGLGLERIQLRAQDGGFSASARLSADVNTTIFLDNPFACLGEAECDVIATADDVPVEIAFGLATGPDGGVELTSTVVNLPLTSADVDLQSEGCATGEVVTWLFDAFENWLLERGVPRIEALLEEQVSVVLSNLLTAALELEVEFGPIAIRGSLDGIEADPEDGLTALGSAELAWSGPNVFDGPAPELPQPGDEPFAGAPEGMFQLAVSDVAVNAALYEAWRGGLLQRLLSTPIAQPTIQLDGIGVVQQLGLPEGTNVAIQADFEAPLAVSFGREDDAVSARINDLHVIVSIRAPATAASTIDAFVDGDAAAAIRVDGEAGALRLSIRDIVVDELRLSGREGEGFVFDRSRFEAFLSRTVLPLISERLGDLPVAPSLQEVFGRFVAVRTLSSFEGWQRIGVDLHSPDPADDVAPATFLDASPSLLPAGTLTFGVRGEDNSTPPSLLRFRTFLDGEALGSPSVRRSVSLDGVDGRHRLQVWAIDLSGNEDPTPATFDFDVDGIPPELTVTVAPEPVLGGRTVNAEWFATDERDDVESRWLVRVVPESGPRRIVDEGPWSREPGVLEVSGLPQGELLELVIEARDGAGNLTSETYGFAASPTSGCAAHGAPARALWLLLACFVLRRRR